MRTENNCGSSIGDDNDNNDDDGDDSEPKKDQFDEEECNADLTVQDGGGREERYGNRYNRDKHFTETSYDCRGNASSKNSKQCDLDSGHQRSREVSTESAKVQQNISRNAQKRSYEQAL